MSVIGSNILVGASGQGGGYNLTNSLRFRSSASAYLNRTQGNGSATSFTASMWVKRGLLSAGHILNSGSSGTSEGWIRFDGNNNISFQDGTNASEITTSAVYRDPSAWYHIVVAVNTANATAADRVIIYVNNVRQTTTGTHNGSNLLSWNKTGEVLAIGRFTRNNTNYFDGYLTEVNFIDGQALTPSSFGETSSTTGVWQPKKYAGTYGTNGFYLPFTDNSALTSGSNAGLGKDFSGNGNYWNTNNISVTSGATYDSMTDVPTLTSATASNFAVLNPLKKPANDSLTNANLQFTGGTTGTVGFVPATQAVSSGKWYFEATLVTSARVFVGIVADTRDTGGNVAASSYSDGYDYRLDTGDKRNNNTATSYGASLSNGDVLGCAFDLDNGKIWWSKNGVWQASGDPVAGTNAAYTGISGTFQPEVGHDSYASPVVAINFGQRPFAYTPPTGYVALNTFNLPTPTIGATASTQANKYMDVNIWTGDGSYPRLITNSGFSPDLVWIKARSVAYNYAINDSVRGTGGTKSLDSATAGAEGQFLDNSNISSFDSNGFTLGSSSSGNITNASGQTFVGWQWRASDNSAVTNTAGSITSTVSANTTSGFSVVTYTGNGASSATIGHGLGVAPSMIIVKSRSNAIKWGVYHVSIGNTKMAYLNETSVPGTSSVYWNNTNPSSSVFTIGNGDEVGINGATYVAYCFSEVAGFSKFGSYTGNGSTDGTFVYTGFRPRFILYKNASLAGTGWAMLDSSRNTFNVLNARLFAESSSAEDTSVSPMDFTSNGFKARSTNDGVNRNGDTIIYMAFAENPFKYSLAR